MKMLSSFPPAHRKRLYQALGVYALLVVLTGAWIAVRAPHTLQDWQSRIPSASAPIKNVYLTPQISDETAEAAPAANPAQPVVDDGKTYISVIVTNMGLAALPTQRAIEDLPPQITLAFSPYGTDVGTWVRKAQAAKHETLMLMPAESTSASDDPGPRALSSRHSDKDNLEKLESLLTQGGSSTGVLNVMGSRFLRDEKLLSLAMNALHQSGSLFIQTPGVEKSLAPSVAAKIGLPFMAANTLIDAQPTDKEIRAQLRSLEETAKKYGYAIGIAQPYPLTMNTLKAWAAGLEKRGIVLAPLRTVWKNKPRYDVTPAAQQQAPAETQGETPDQQP